MTEPPKRPRGVVHADRSLVDPPDALPAGATHSGESLMDVQPPGRESQQQWLHRAIPSFNPETAQEWVEAIERSRQALRLAYDSGIIVDRELAQILDDSLRQTWFIARALRNSVADVHPRVAALEERKPWWRALPVHLRARTHRRRQPRDTGSTLDFMRLGDAPLGPPGPHS